MPSPPRLSFEFATPLFIYPAVSIGLADYEKGSILDCPMTGGVSGGLSFMAFGELIIFNATRDRNLINNPIIPIKNMLSQKDS